MHNNLEDTLESHSSLWCLAATSSVVTAEYVGCLIYKSGLYTVISDINRMLDQLCISIRGIGADLLGPFDFSSKELKP